MMIILEDIESKFKKLNNIEIDLKDFPLEEYTIIRYSNNKLKKKQYGEVFTPLYLVDRMIQQAAPIPETRTLDLCAGLGQFTIRLMRYYQNNFPIFNIEEFLRKHYFNEIQLESCNKLKEIFGSKINLLNGDCKKINLPKFDLIFSNPPYNNNAHIKIFNKLIKESIATEYVIVHPANWLIDLKGKENLFVDFKQTISKKLKSVTMFNGNIVFDIGLHYPCVITHIDCNHCGIINVDYFGNKYTVNDINDISKYGKEWRAIVKPFFDTIKSNMPNGNVWNYKSENTTFNKVYCQIAGIRGHVNNRNKESFFLDDFYTLILKDLDSNKGIRKSDMPTFEFNSIIERDNFIDYLKTDFVRFCLSLFKINANLARGEMEIIPWLDFTEKWDDEKLFKYFNINNETQEYIREFLPDYYKIRN